MEKSCESVSKLCIKVIAKLHFYVHLKVMNDEDTFGRITKGDITMARLVSKCIKMEIVNSYWILNDSSHLIVHKTYFYICGKVGM